ncbi:MAG: stage III sporulation protein AH [Bacillota bacterium]
MVKIGYLQSGAIEKYRNQMLLAALALVLFIIGSVLSSAKRSPETAPVIEAVNTSARGYERALAQELERMLSLVDGAGRVSCSVTLEGGVRTETAGNSSVTSRRTEEQDAQGGVRTITEETESVQVVMARSAGGEHPVIVWETAPKIAGVLVVADGASDSTIKAQLAQAVQTLLGLPAHKVIVLPRKGGI